MSAVAGVTVLPILRPAYDNRRLGQPRQWVADNERTLLDFWSALSRIELDGPADDDYFTWTAIQRDIEVWRELAE